MQREKNLELLKQNLRNQNLVKHCLAVEAAMRGLAWHFGEHPALEPSKDPLLSNERRGPTGQEAQYGASEEKWGTCGLLHDIDYEKSKGEASVHSKLGSEMLKELGFDEEICEAVLTHNEAQGIEPKTLIAKALFCVDPLTGLIVAATLVLPTKKLTDLKTENVLNRFGEKSFARGANREIIARCQSYLGLGLEQFVEIVLSAMQKIADDLGL